MWRLWSLTTLLLVFSASLTNGAEVTYIPAGWTAPVQGYFLEEQAGRDVLSALQSRRETSERWEAAYTDLRTEFLTTADELKGQIKAIEDNINAERTAWRSEVRRARTGGWVWAAAGVLAGYFVGK